MVLQSNKKQQWIIQLVHSISPFNQSIQLFESTIHPIIIKMIIQIDSTGTESLHIQCWIQWFATFHELFNINDHPLFIKCSIQWSSTFYQIVKSIDHPMSTNWWWTGHWLILKWSSTDWSNDHMIQWLHDPFQGSHDPIILLFIFFSVSFLQTYLIVHRYPYTNSNLITTSILHVDQATSRIRRGRHILINRQPKWVH